MTLCWLPQKNSISAHQKQICEALSMEMNGANCKCYIVAVCKQYVSKHDFSVQKLHYHSNVFSQLFIYLVLF